MVSAPFFVASVFNLCFDESIVGVNVQGGDIVTINH